MTICEHNEAWNCPNCGLVLSPAEYATWKAVKRLSPQRMIEEHDIAERMNLIENERNTWRELQHTREMLMDVVAVTGGMDNLAKLAPLLAGSVRILNLRAEEFDGTSRYSPINGG